MTITATSTDYGTVVEVSTVTLGDELAAAVSAPPSVNLSLNPSFETNVTGWAANAGATAPVQSATHAYVGTQSMLVARGSGTSTLWASRSIGTQVDASKNYVISAYLWVPAANPTNGGMRVSGTDVTSSPTTIRTTTRDAWARVEFPFTTNAVGNAVTFFIDGGTSGQVWVDAVMLHEGSTALPYGDGDQPGWAWDGTAHASASHTTTTPAAPAGSTALRVKDAVDFADDGGWLTIGTETIYYTTAEDDEDNDVGILTLSTPLASTYDEGERVTLDPPSFEKYAQVMIGDFGEAQQAVVPHALWDKIGDGIRPDGEGEVVALTLQGSEFVIADVVGSEPVIDGSLLDPEIPLNPAILPPVEFPPPTAPVTSPTPEVIGGIGNLLVRWAPVTTGTPPIDIEVHLSATTPVAGDATTLATTVNGTQATLRTLPGTTTPLSYVDANGDPVVYHVALRAKTADDPALAAPLSAEDSGSMVQITGPDIAVDAAWVGTFSWDHATGGTMDAEMIVAGDVYAEGAAGERVSLSGSGFSVTGPTADGNPIYVSFPTDGAKPNIFSGTIEANTAEIVNGATLRSANNMVASQATLNVSSGIQAPQSAPATDIIWPGFNADVTTKRNGPFGNFAFDPSACYGLAWDGTRWITVQKTTGLFGEDASRIWAISTTGVTSVLVDFDVFFTGITSVGGSVYAVGEVPFGGGYSIGKFNASWDMPNAENYNRINDTQLPTMGTDGTKVLVAETVDTTGAVRVREYATSDLATISATTTSTDILPGVRLGGVARGSFDYGSTRIVTSAGGQRTAADFLVGNSSLASQPDDNWPRGIGDLRGFAWDGTNFWALASSGLIRQYTGLKWTTEPSRWQAAYTWRDTNTTTSRTASITTNTTAGTQKIITAATPTFTAADVGSAITGTGIPASTTIASVESSLAATMSANATAAGTITATIFSSAHETNLSPRVTLNPMTKRAQLKITTAAIPTGTDPDDPDRVSIYLGRATSGSASMIRQNTSTSPTLTTTTPVFTVDGTHPVAPGSNNFPSTTPGKIASALGGFTIDGNSNGSVGTGTFRTSVDARVSAKVAGGSATATTNASGVATFTHSLGVVPSGLTWNIETAALAARYGTTTAKTSTTFSVQFYTGGNVALGSGGAITVGYTAIA